MEYNAAELTAMNTHFEDKESQMRNRMDRHYDLWNLKEIKYDESPTAINITANYPRTFADKVQSHLAAANMQIICRVLEQEGKDVRDDVAKLERLFHYLFYQNNKLLESLLLLPLREQLIWHSMIRGWTCAKVLTYTVNGGLVCEYMPLDRRWLTYGMGKNGLEWVIYKTFKSKDEIENEWGVHPKGGMLSNFTTMFRSTDKDIEVLDCFDGKDNAVIIGKEFVKPPAPHGFKEIPIIILPMATRPPIATSVGLDNGGYGNGIYAAVEHIYNLENQMLTIEATRGKLMSKQPIVHYHTSKVVGLDKTIWNAEEVLNLDMENSRLDRVPMSEIPQTLEIQIGRLDMQRQQATLSDLDFGELMRHPLSGTAIAELKEASRKVYGGIIRNLNYVYTSMCHMIKRQLIDQNQSVDVETEYDNKYMAYQVEPVFLEQAHTIKVEFSSQSSWEELDTLQKAQMLKQNGVPDAFIWEHVYKMDNVKEVMEQKAIEIAWATNPQLPLYQALVKLNDEGREDEFGLVAEQMMEMDLMKKQAITGEGGQPQ